MIRGDQHNYRLGLIGFPLGHSLSPILHQAALDSAGLKGDYRLFPISPTPEGEKEMQELIGQLRCGGLDGLNVTIPHKQNVQKYVDELSPTAQVVKAVNTLYLNQQGKLVGDNTDVPGFRRDLSRLTSRQNGKAVVLGAGGSARAVVFALSQSGWNVLILARREEQAAALAAEFQPIAHQPQQIAWGTLDCDRLVSSGLDCQLLVNSTPVGMYPNANACPWPVDLPLPPQAAIYDLIYNPLATQLIQRARTAQLAALNGSGMLSAQAALAFAHWTGLEPPFEVMERAFPQQL
ncbi:MAG: shikimate dehydrogenase [Anaerolineaceae bacterium]|nr:shikimate dehydrogenase [Anaerolineaceae bacterium]